MLSRKATWHRFVRIQSIQGRAALESKPHSSIDTRLQVSSGLSCMTVCRLLLQEKEGITICATIHCPSIETFRLFDRVLLLQHGRAVYHGDNGAPVIDYFQTSFPDVREVTSVEPAWSACNAIHRHVCCRCIVRRCAGSACCPIPMCCEASVCRVSCNAVASGCLSSNE